MPQNNPPDGYIPCVVIPTQDPSKALVRFPAHSAVRLPLPLTTLDQIAEFAATSVSTSTVSAFDRMWHTTHCDPKWLELAPRRSVLSVKESSRIAHEEQRVAEIINRVVGSPSEEECQKLVRGYLELYPALASFYVTCGEQVIRSTWTNKQLTEGGS